MVEVMERQINAYMKFGLTTSLRSWPRGPLHCHYYVSVFTYWGARGVLRFWFEAF